MLDLILFIKLAVVLTVLYAGLNVHQLTSSHAQLNAKIGEFRTSLERHIREEEEKIFPSLRSRLTKEDNSALTTAMNREGFKLA